MTTDVIQVQVTSDKSEELERIVDTLLHRRLIACGQITEPITSRYWWKGEIESSREWMCLLKTTTTALDDVISVVRDLHSYETPEILVLPAVGGSDDYLDWVRRSVVQKEGG